MKKSVALLLTLLFMIVLSAGIFSVFADNEVYYYSLNTVTAGASKQFSQGDTVTVRLSLTDKDKKNFDYCGLSARISIPFEIYSVSYTVPDKGAIPVSVYKSNNEADASAANPYMVDIEYMPEFSEISGASDGGARGGVTFTFTISEVAATDYKDIKVESIRAYIDVVEMSVVSEDVSSEDVSSEETQSDETSDSEESSEETQSEQQNPSETSSNETSDSQGIELPIDIFPSQAAEKHIRTEITLKPQDASNVDGKGSTLRIRINDKNVQNAQLSDISVDGIALSPAFSPDVTSYTANVSAGTSQVKINAAPVFSNATVSFSSTDATVDGEGNVTLSDKKNQRVRISVTASTSTSSYFVTFILPDDVSSAEDTSSTSDGVSSQSDDTSSDINDQSGTESSDISSDTESETPSDVIPGTVSSRGGESRRGSVNTIYIILIVILAILCIFVLIMILIKLGVFGRRDGDDEEKSDGADDFVLYDSKAVNIDAFEKASTTHAAEVNSNYSITRVVTIPDADKKPDREEKDDGFDFIFEDDTENTPKAEESAGADAGKESFFTINKKEKKNHKTAKQAQSTEKAEETKPQPDTESPAEDPALNGEGTAADNGDPASADESANGDAKSDDGKKKSFFFDDDFFDEF